MANYTHYCYKCKSFLEDNDIFRDTHEYRETGYVHTGCKWCGSDDIEKCGHCPICGKAIKKGEEFCKDCYKIVSDTLLALCNELKANVDDFEGIVCNTLGL